VGEGKFKKCSFPDGWNVDFGPFSVDPCLYQTVEVHHNCTVEIVKCVKCGNTEIRWAINEEEKDDFDRYDEEEPDIHMTMNEEDKDEEDS
jgi:hypothetical protein